jgi:hypothetical protein
MFKRLLRPLWTKLRAPRALLTASAIMGYTLLKNKLYLDSPEINQEEDLENSENIIKDLTNYVKELKKVEICESGQLL